MVLELLEQVLIFLTDAISKESNAEISNSFGSYNTRKHTVKFSTGLLMIILKFQDVCHKLNLMAILIEHSSDLKSYFLQGAYTDDNTLLKH